MRQPFDMGFDRIVGRQRQKAFGIGEAFEFDVQPLADGRIGAVGGDHIVGAILLDRQWAFDADRDPVGILRDAQYAALEQRPAMRMRIEPGTEQPRQLRSEEHTSELQSLMRISYAVLCLKKKKTPRTTNK